MSKRIQKTRSSAELTRLLAKTRRERELTQAALSLKAGLPQSHISKIEHGRVDPRLSSVMELARLLDLEVMLVPRKYVPMVQSIAVDDGTQTSLLDAEPPAPYPLYRLRGRRGEDTRGQRS